jgi:hypothetical protein
VVIKYRPQGPTLAAFHKSPAFVRIIIGPLGSAKTFSAINEILDLCHNQVPDNQGVRHNRWCIARDTMPNLKAATIPDARVVLDKLNPDGWNWDAPIRWTHSYPRKDGTTVEVELMFRSFDGIQDVVDARGMQLTGVWVDELGEFNKVNLDMLIGRVKRYPPRAQVPNARFDVLGTSNAVPRDHWLYAIVERPPPNWWVGVQPGGVIKVGNEWVENPRAENLQNLAKNYYRDQLGGKKESWIRQNLANEFVHHTDGRPVHPDFNEQYHVGKVHAIPGLPLTLGFDFGRTPAMIVMQRQVSGQWHVLKELVTQNMGANKFGKIAKKLLNQYYNGFVIEDATGDPAGTQMTQTDDDTPFMMLEKQGIEALPAHTNDPEVRFAVLDELFTTMIEGEPAIIIDEGCTTLISGLAGAYQFRRIQIVGREEYRDKPDKGPTSHICEATHYGLLGAGEGDILFDQEGQDEWDEIESWAPSDHYYE